MSEPDVLIVGAAPAEGCSRHYARIIREARTLIAADGGVLVCLTAGRVPDVCVGDFDSTPADTLARAADGGAEILRYPTVKDVSDLDLAVDVARDRDHRKVGICAAFTGRVDHTLSAFGTLVSAADLDAYADEPGWVAIPLDAAVRPTCRLNMSPGTLVSVLAFGGAAVVSAEGLAYPMDRTELLPMSSHGLSNVCREHSQSITVHAGRALVIVDRGADSFALQSSVAITDTL